MSPLVTMAAGSSTPSATYCVIAAGHSTRIRITGYRQQDHDMDKEEQAELERKRLNLPSLVAQRFAFLEGFGFLEVESSPTIARYSRRDLRLSVYLGRRSHEVGLLIGRGDDRYSISEIIRATDPTGADKYRNWTAVSPDQLAAALDRLAELLKCYGER